MKPAAKMMLAANRRDDRPEERREDDRREDDRREDDRRGEYARERRLEMGIEGGVYPRYERGGGEENNYRGPGNRMEYEGRDYNRTEYNGFGLNNGVEGRFRDRRGREHYDDGRFAPERRNAIEYPESAGDAPERPYIRPYLIPTRPRGMGFMSDGVEGMQRREEHMAKSERHEHQGFDAEMAARWTKAMHNADGTTGPHWTQDQAKSLMAQVGASNIAPAEFWAVLNAMRSDYQKVAKKFGTDRPEYYAEMAKAWLEDKDAVPDKAAAYYEHIVRH